MTFRGTGPSSEVCDEPRTILFILCSVAVLLQATSNKVETGVCSFLLRVVVLIIYFSVLSAGSGGTKLHKYLLAIVCKCVYGNSKNTTYKLCLSGFWLSPTSLMKIIIYKLKVGLVVVCDCFCLLCCM